MVLFGIAVIAALLASPVSAQVTDDAGQPISEEEIERVTDPGVSGGVIGGLLGLVGGLALSVAFVDAEGGNSTFVIAPVGLAAVGAYAGASLARVDRDEAIQRIRSRRRSEGDGVHSPEPAPLTP